MNDVVISKIDSLQRCARRARQELAAAGAGFEQDLTRQDAAILNVTRACELAIDLANHAIKVRRLGVPADSRESFQRLVDDGLIDAEVGRQMQSMVGFRHVAIQDYRRLDLAIVRWIIAWYWNRYPGALYGFP